MNTYSIFLVGMPELFLLVILIGILAFEVWMFVDAIKNKKIADSMKIFWLVGMLVLHPLIAVLYYFTDYQKVHVR